MRIGDVAVLAPEGLDELITALVGLGYETKGPVVRDGAILPGPVRRMSDLPVGAHDVQAPGQYHLEQSEDHAVFGWAVGPGSWKAEFFPPTQEVWRATVDSNGVTATTPQLEAPPLAVIGARPCELAAIDVLDRVLLEGAVPDPRYAARRAGAFVVAAECGSPAATCFCTSMGSGPGAASRIRLGADRARR